MSSELRIVFMRVIADLSIEHYDALKNKFTYDSYCQRLKHTMLTGGILDASQKILFARIDAYFKEVYGMSGTISSELVCDFFLSEAWRGIYEHIKKLNDNNQFK
jgi:hypothetical protein